MGIGTEASELEAWREAHKTLLESVVVAKEAVAAARAQRRYWMEEICANLTTEGRLTATSVWKRPAPPSKKSAPKRKAAPKLPLPSTNKRKKSDETITDDETSIPSNTNKGGKSKASSVGGKKQGKRDGTESEGKKKSSMKIESGFMRGMKPEKGDDLEDDDDDDDTDDSDEGANPASSSAMQQDWGSHQPVVAPPLMPNVPYLGGMPIGQPVAPAGQYDMMSHIPEELRPFLAQAGGLPPPMAQPVVPSYINPFTAVAQDSDGISDDDDEDD